LGFCAAGPNDSFDTPVHRSPPQQTFDHPVVRARQQACASVCRALVLLALAAGCGELHFIPSPYTPQDVELIYSAQEHITVMRWRVSATEALEDNRFEMLGPNGYQTIDFSQSVFEGGITACADKRGGSCAQYIVRGEYRVPAGARPVQAVHDLYGVLPGLPPLYREVSATLTFKSIFRPHNDLVYVNIGDTVAREGAYIFPRRYERAMWPAIGLCLSDAAPTEVTFALLDDTSTFPPDTPLTEEGIYCIGARPIPADGGGSTLLQARVATQPELVTMTREFIPPVERSPIIYQLVLDLEIPVPDRCADVIQKIESLTQKYLTAETYPVPVYKLPTINLAENASSKCAQANERLVETAEVAQAIKELVTTLPGVHQQVHWMYFNNLDAPLPTQLTTSLQTLIAALKRSPPNYQLEPYAFLVGPPGTTLPMDTVDWWGNWIWETADEVLEMNLDKYQNDNLPRTTQLHDRNEPVLLLSPEETAGYEGKLIKICESSNGAQPFGQLPFPHNINEPSWTIAAADPPSYLVTLKEHLVARVVDFVQQSSIVRYQICTRYCDGHGYVNGANEGRESWVQSFDCMGPDY
jgi:hypothetical protein